MCASITVGEGVQTHTGACTRLPVAEPVERVPADWLMGAGHPILPSAERRVATACGRSAQPWHRAVVEIGVADPVMRRTGAVAEIVEVSVANGLPCPTRPTEVVECGVHRVNAGAGLGERQARNEQEEKKKWHGTPPG